MLNPFGGKNSSTRDWGYDLPILVGHLEGLASDEGMEEMSWKGPKAKRLKLVEEAISLLDEAVEMGNENS